MIQIYKQLCRELNIATAAQKTPRFGDKECLYGVSHRRTDRRASLCQTNRRMSHRQIKTTINQPPNRLLFNTERLFRTTFARRLGHKGAVGLDIYV